MVSHERLMMRKTMPWRVRQGRGKERNPIPNQVLVMGEEERHVKS